MKRIAAWMLLVIVVLSVGALADGAMAFQNIVDASNALQTFSATIVMTRHSEREASTIEFEFTYVPPAKMRIEYHSPKALVGQLLIMNGDRVYTYMPALHRSMLKTVSGNSHNEGEEMGFLYYFVNRSVADFTQASSQLLLEGPQAYAWEYEAETVSYNAYRVTLPGAEGKEIVWCDARTFVPIAVDIYANDKLTIEVRVVDYTYNGTVPEEAFIIPEK